MLKNDNRHKKACYHVAKMKKMSFCGGPVRPNMLNMPKSASEQTSRRAVSRNLVNCSTVRTSCKLITNQQQIEATELEHYGRRTCSKLCSE